MTLNARSIINKIDILQATVYDIQPDIIGITETWANDSILDAELQLEGYQLFRCDRNNEHKGGGVLLYVRNLLNPSEFRTNSLYGEHIWCRIGKLVIGVCYRSPNLGIVGQGNSSKLRAVLQEVADKDVLIMGDFNYPNIDWKTGTAYHFADPDTQEFIQTIEDCFYSQHVLCPTRGDAILDIILSRDPDLVSNVTVIHNLGNSDHNMVCFSVHYEHEISNVNRIIRDFNKGNFDSMKDILAHTDWDSLMEGSVNDSWQNFKQLLWKLMDDYIPVKNISSTSKTMKPIWMTNKAFRLVRRKKRVFGKYKDSKHPAVKSACKAAKAEIRRARKQFERKLAQNIKSDSKSFFAYARSKTKSKVQVGPLLDNNGVLLDSEKDKTSSLNNYFAAVFTSEDTTDIPIPTAMTSSDYIAHLQDVHFSVEDVMSLLSKLRIDKAGGNDELSPRLLLELKDYIAYPLYLLFRRSLDIGVVPDDWKCANITPIFKKGHRNKAENYRPVSLTSQVCKIFETIIRNSVVKYLETNRLILDSQHGFRKGRSCLSNLLVFLDKVTGSIDSGEAVDVIFMDFAKAFDKVPHIRLGRKLESHGITGKLLTWILDWLSGRQQRVCINGVTSDWQLVLSGVPQGSVLGPILFLIYINDLDCGIINWILKFADDTKIFGVVNSIEEHAGMQDDLNKLLSWSKEWQMLFNVEKCKVMHFGRRNVGYNYHLDSKSLDEVSEEKDLGVTITCDLKASQQCTHAYSKANRILGVINRSIVYKSKEILIQLYKSLVRPHLEFCTAAWSPHYVKDKELLEKVQRRFTRMIPGLKDVPYNERLQILGLWSLEERRIRSDLIEVYKMIHMWNLVDSTWLSSRV